ncbi:hypothetical protein [Ralstonia phage RSF1]|uniref:Uncharacterized protein n=1 Tax=Ralstonia phage RSF1 TaxID=1689679 RepID=A0A0K2QR61_9CAUD|nr:hypothetical protein AVU11_gp014 [Ralstonia phage RSF1]BAS04806.1 hypothetical protein [Ralstonia phage RSF1]
MSNYTQVTVVEFCLFLSDKFMEGKKFEEVDWEAVNARVERQNLTVGEEKLVREFVFGRRMAMRDEDNAAAKAEAVIEKAKKGIQIPYGLAHASL